MTEPIPKGRVIDGNLANELDSRFLNSNFFIGRGTLGMTINRIEHHDDFKYENGQKKQNVNFCFFEGTDKPLELCKTNLKSLIAIAQSNDPKDIYGKKFGFYAKNGAGFKGVGYGVRVDHDYKPNKKEEKK